MKARELRNIHAHLAMGLVKPTAVPSKKLEISPVSFWLNGVDFIEFDGGFTPDINAPTTGFRWVLVTLDVQSGRAFPTLVEGAVASSNPVMPKLPRRQLPVAAVLIKAGTNVVTPDMVIDLRNIFSAGDHQTPHNDIPDRDVFDAHPISSITGLEEALDDRITHDEMEVILTSKADAEGTNSKVFELNMGDTGELEEDIIFLFNRGNLPPVGLKFNSTEGRMEFTNDGTEWYAISNSGFMGDASELVKGLLKLSVAPAEPTEPIAVGDNDPRLLSTEEKTSVMALESRVTSVETDMTNKAETSDLGAVESRVTGLESTVADKAEASDLSTLEGRVGAVETSVLSKAEAASVTALDTRVGTLESTIDSKADTTTVSAINTRVGTLESTILNKADSSTVTALDTRVGTLESTIVNKANSSTVTALDTRVGTLESTMVNKADSSTVTALDTRVGTLELAVVDKAATSDLTALSGRVTTLETAIVDKASTSSVTAVEGRVTTLETTIVDKADASDLTAVEGRVTTLETTIVDKADASDLTAVEGRVTTLETTALTANSVSGSFTTSDGKTITVVNGQITSIV